MSKLILKEVLPANLPVLDNMLQLYAHELNKFFNFTIILGDNGRYLIKPAAIHLADGWGYFIVVGCEYAGFILLNHRAKTKGGVFISEFFIMPRFRRGYFYKDVIARLASTLDGIVEYRVMKKNKRALFLFDDLAKRFLSAAIQKTDEYENGIEYSRYMFDTANITYHKQVFI